MPTNDPFFYESLNAGQQGGKWIISAVCPDLIG